MQPMASPRLGFIGFGEAGPAIAGGLSGEGINGIQAYDILQSDAQTVGLIEARANQACVKLSQSPATLADGQEIIISAVTCTDAVDAARSIAPHMGPGQVYLDVNSVSPETKKAVGEIIEASGAAFVEASIMSPIHPNRHKSPMLFCGPSAPALIERLSAFGMNLEDMGPEFGRASATKMFRSIIFKGIEALMQECVVAADQYGVAEKVLDSVGENYPELDWNALASYFIGRSVMHGVRRAHEMEEVAETLRAMDMQPFMAEAAAKRIAWLGRQNLKEAFNGQEPKTYQQVLAAIKQGQA
jgi:3-hydroxyisobutyrate dehydrogenase-like beta-hydroxyacid dehydrogenase